MVYYKLKWFNQYAISYYAESINLKSCEQVVESAILCVSISGGGSMVGALVGSTQREPLVVGKPSTFMMDYLANEYTFLLPCFIFFMHNRRVFFNVLFAFKHYYCKYVYRIILI